MPTTAHFIYIPVVLVLGIVLGFILGGRAARDAFAAQQEKEASRAARRAARNSASTPGGGGDLPATDGSPPGEG